MPGAARRNSSREASPGERTHFASVLLVFCANGLQAGAYTVLVADLADALGLSGSSLGVALAVLSGTSIPGVLAAGRLSDRLGRRPVLVAGSAAAGLFFLLLALVDGYAALLGIMAFGGVAFALFDLSYPSIGGDYERRHEREAMTKLYVAFDAGVASGAFGSGLALHLGVGYGIVYASVGAALLLLAVVALLLPLPGRGAGHARGEPRKVPPRRKWRSETTAGRREGHLLTRGVVLAVLFVGLVSLLDAALEGFSSIYLRHALGSGPLLAGAGIAASMLASLLGRLRGSAVVSRLSERWALVGAGTATALGVVALVATPLPLVAAAGLLAVRAFEAPILPVSYSLAARSASPGRSGQAVSLAWGCFYVAFLLGPLIVGVLADAVGLRAALSLFVLTSLAIAAIAGLAYREG